MFTHAITRKPCPDFGQGITTSSLGAPDFSQMQALNKAYVAALQEVVRCHRSSGHSDKTDVAMGN